MKIRRLVPVVIGATLVIAACGSDSKDEAASTTAAAAGGDTTAAAAGGGGGCTVGVSWNNYQEERWAKWDEPAL